MRSVADAYVRAALTAGFTHAFAFRRPVPRVFCFDVVLGNIGVYFQACYHRCARFHPAWNADTDSGRHFDRLPDAAHVSVRFALFAAAQLSDSLSRVSRPYVEKSYNRIAYAAIVQLFVFTIFALLLRYEVAIVKKETKNRVIYDVLLGVLTCSVYVIPVVIVVRRLMWSLEEEEIVEHWQPSNDEAQFSMELDEAAPHIPHSGESAE